MTFVDIVNAVLERFTEQERLLAQQWVNLRYGQLWTAERWTFRKADVAVSAVAGDPQLESVPADLGRVAGLWDSSGCELRYYRTDEFNRLFLPNGGTVTGQPWGYTVIGPVIKVAPTPAATDPNWRLLHWRRLTPLSLDTDEPLFPEEYHWLLVPGAQAQGQVVKQDPFQGMSEAAWLQGLELMRRDYLEDADMAEQWAADRTGSWQR